MHITWLEGLALLLGVARFMSEARARTNLKPRFALPAARGSECAANPGRFAEYVTAVFRKQDSLGLRTWGAFAEDAGVPDARASDECV